MSYTPELPPRLSEEEAKDLEDKIIKGIQELESYLYRFVAGRGWEVRGYASFVDWWDDKLVSQRLGPAVRAVVTHELKQQHPLTGRELTDREVGARVGVDEGTVRKDTGRRKIKSAEKSAKSINTSPAVPEQSTVIDAEVVEADTSDIGDTSDIVDVTSLSDTDATADTVPVPEVDPEVIQEHKNKVTEARRILLEVLKSENITPEIIHLIVDDVIPEIEEVATEIEKGVTSHTFD